MRRWVFYLVAGLITFGIGSIVAESFNRQSEKINPNIQEVIETGTFGNFREDLRRNRLQTPIDNQSAVQKKKPFTCNNKVLSVVLNDSRKDREFNTDFEDYLKAGDASDCRDVLFIKQAVDLDGDETNEFVVRGKNIVFCGATGNCSMWIYKKSGNSYKKLLDTGGKFLTVKQDSTNGYKNIFVEDHASCCSSYQTTFKFNRGKYQESKCLFVDESIQGNKNITTCAEEFAGVEEKSAKRKTLIETKLKN